MEVVDHIHVINLCNRVTVSKVPLDVVAQGLRGKLGDTGLVVLDEGGAEVLPVVDRAGRKSFEPIESLTAHHHREVRHHDAVVVVGSSDSDGVRA